MYQLEVYNGSKRDEFNGQGELFLIDLTHEELALIEQFLDMFRKSSQEYRDFYIECANKNGLKLDKYKGYLT